MAASGTLSRSYTPRSFFCVCFPFSFFCSKSVLLFVIRDHIEEETPLELLQQKVVTEVESVWAEIRKPEGWESKSISDLFYFEFCGLPHYKLRKKEFESSVTALRGR